VIRILALDTSTWWGGVALLERESSRQQPVVVAELGLRVRESHASHLLDWIGLLLDRAGWPRSGLDGFVATRGPGFFTGIRIGLGTVRGLSLAMDRPCSGVTTLRAMAQAVGPGDSKRVALLPAGRGEVYGACYDPASAPPVELIAPWLGPPEAALGAEAASGSLLVFGAGLAECSERLPESAGRIRHGAEPRSIAAGAGQVALLRGDLEGERDPLLSPLYLRQPDVLLESRGE